MAEAGSREPAPEYNCSLRGNELTLLTLGSLSRRSRSDRDHRCEATWWWGTDELGVFYVVATSRLVDLVPKLTICDWREWVGTVYDKCQPALVVARRVSPGQSRLHQATPIPSRNTKRVVRGRRMPNWQSRSSAIVVGL